MRTFPVLALILLLAVGCGGQSDSENTDASRPEVAPRAAPPLAQLPAPETPTADGTDEESGGDQAGGATGTGVPMPPVQRQIIRTGSISLTVESLDSAERALTGIVTSAGGYTGNTSRSRASGSAMTGTVEVRVPSAKFDGVLSAVRQLGSVESENISASDVTQEYIDLEARLKGQQQLEERLLKLLAERPGKLSDIVEIEQKLADVRSVIEGIQGRLRFLRSQVELSTLQVIMTEPGAVGTSQTQTFGGRISDAFEQGVDGLVGLLAGLITLLMVILPFALVAIVVVLIYRAWRRRHPAKPRGTPPEKV